MKITKNGKFKIDKDNYKPLEITDGEIVEIPTQTKPVKICYEGDSEYETINLTEIVQEIYEHMKHYKPIDNDKA